MIPSSGLAEKSSLDFKVLNSCVVAKGMLLILTGWGQKLQSDLDLKLGEASGCFRLELLGQSAPRMRRDVGTAPWQIIWRMPHDSPTYCQARCCGGLARKNCKLQRQDWLRILGHHRPTGDGLSLHFGTAADRGSTFTETCCLISKARHGDPNALLSEANVKAMYKHLNHAAMCSSDCCTPHRVL